MRKISVADFPHYNIYFDNRRLLCRRMTYRCDNEKCTHCDHVATSFPLWRQARQAKSSVCVPHLRSCVYYCDNARQLAKVEKWDGIIRCPQRFYSKANMSNGFQDVKTFEFSGRQFALLSLRIDNVFNMALVDVDKQDNVMILKGGAGHQKNWLPLVTDDRSLYFLTNLDNCTVALYNSTPDLREHQTGENGRLRNWLASLKFNFVPETPHLRGNAIVQMEANRWIGIGHSISITPAPGGNARKYDHYWFSIEYFQRRFSITAVSHPFDFGKSNMEFVSCVFRPSAENNNTFRVIFSADDSENYTQDILCDAVANELHKGYKNTNIV